MRFEMMALSVLNAGLLRNFLITSSKYSSLFCLPFPCNEGPGIILNSVGCGFLTIFG